MEHVGIASMRSLMAKVIPLEKADASAMDTSQATTMDGIDVMKYLFFQY